MKVQGTLVGAGCSSSLLKILAPTRGRVRVRRRDVTPDRPFNWRVRQSCVSCLLEVITSWSVGWRDVC
jgi:hypothetical protein